MLLGQSLARKDGAGVHRIARYFIINGVSASAAPWMRCFAGGFVLDTGGKKKIHYIQAGCKAECDLLFFPRQPIPVRDGGA
jgi:hypothetical protein